MNVLESTMTIGQAIKNARQSRNLTQAKLSKLAGISLVTLQMWEQDKNNPTVFLLMSVADVLKISLDDLVGRNYIHNTAEKKI